MPVQVHGVLVIFQPFLVVQAEPLLVANRESRTSHSVVGTPVAIEQSVEPTCRGASIGLTMLITPDVAALVGMTLAANILELEKVNKAMKVRHVISIMRRALGDAVCRFLGRAADKWNIG